LPRPLGRHSVQVGIQSTMATNRQSRASCSRISTSETARTKVKECERQRGAVPLPASSLLLVPGAGASEKSLPAAGSTVQAVMKAASLSRAGLATAAASCVLFPGPDLSCTPVRLYLYCTCTASYANACTVPVLIARIKQIHLSVINGVLVDAASHWALVLFVRVQQGQVSLS
jgi:hypothetical protein